MTYIKLCGMTSVEDARIAADLGIQAIGLVFHAASPRHLTPERAREIASAVPDGIHRVGIFVDESPERIAIVAGFCGLTHAQLHGTESPAIARALPIPVIKALRVRTVDDLSRVDAFAETAVMILLDAFVSGKAGGTGETFDWSLAAEPAKKHRVILAGGLSPENVADAMRRVRPFGVDASSSLESAPGVKDPTRMRAFVDAVRKAGLEPPVP